MLEYFPFWVKNCEQMISIRLDCRCENDRLNVALLLLLFQVSQQLLHAVTFIDKHWLPCVWVRQQKLMLWRLRVRIRHITEILVTNESMQEKVINLKKYGQRIFRDLHRRQEDRLVVDVQVLEDSSVLLHCVGGFFWLPRRKFTIWLLEFGLRITPCFFNQNFANFCLVVEWLILHELPVLHEQFVRV